MKRLRIHSAAMEGRIFIQFIALLITTRLKQVMNEAGWFKNHDLRLMFLLLIVAEMHWKLSKEPDIFSRQCKALPPMWEKAA